MIETTFSQLAPISVEFHQKFIHLGPQNLDAINSFIHNHRNFKNFITAFKLESVSHALLISACCHTSFINEFPMAGLTNNERLEFLGDSILSALVANYLFEKFPKASEGELSRFRGAIINEDSWSNLAELIGLPKLILIGKGETSSSLFNAKPILCDHFEAIFGAIYIDQGFKASEQFFQNVLEMYRTITGKSYISEDLLNSFDAKSRLQELTMKHFKKLPEYIVKQISADLFEVHLSVPKLSTVITQAASKKKASTEAAKIALTQLINILQE